MPRLFAGTSCGRCSMNTHTTGARVSVACRTRPIRGHLVPYSRHVPGSYEYLNGKPPWRLRDTSAQAVLKYILCDPQGPLYVVRPQHPEYRRQELHSAAGRDGKMYRVVSFAIRAHLIDDIFLDRVKEIA